MAITISPVSFLGFKPNTKAKHPSKEQFIQWVNQYQDAKDKDEKKRIAERVLKATEGLVVSIATALIKKSRGCELEDLIQAGRWGVFLSMMTWDRKVSEKHQSGFITHASFRIRAEIYRHCRKERRGVVASPQNKMEEKLKGNPDYQRPVEFIPWDEPYYAGTSTGDQFDVLSGEVHSHRRGALEQEPTSRRAELRVLNNILQKEASEVLGRREMDTIWRFLNGEEMRDIGKRQGRTRQAVYASYVKSIDKMRKHMRGKYPELENVGE